MRRRQLPRLGSRRHVCGTEGTGTEGPPAELRLLSYVHTHTHTFICLCETTDM